MLWVRLYAGDAIIFPNPYRGDINNLLQILEQFGRATGLCINPSVARALNLMVSLRGLAAAG